MKRRTFIQQSAVLSTVTVLSSPLELIAKENSNCELNLASFIATGKKAIVNGFAIDAVSKDPIKANIQIASDSGFYSALPRADGFNRVAACDVYTVLDQ